jgi:hypothetical protein
MAQLHSPLVQITWTETARGVERFAFQHEGPIELRFGLRFEPTFFTSGNFNHAFLSFQVFYRSQAGEALVYDHTEDVDASQLPGAPGPDIWVGMSLGQALQLTQESGVRLSGVFDFRPHVFVGRSHSDVGAQPAEFAVAPEPHSFVVARGNDSDHSSSQFERFVGGAGRPD